MAKIVGGNAARQGVEDGRTLQASATANARVRNRPLGILAIAATIALGLASRRFRSLLPVFLGKYPGDALWALMVFLGWGLLFPSASKSRVAALTIFTSFTIEFLKFYQATWIVSLRYTTVGHLIFGQVFSWQNLVAYTVGVGIGWAFEMLAAPKASTLALRSNGTKVALHANRARHDPEAQSHRNHR